VLTNVLEKPTASIFTVDNSDDQNLNFHRREKYESEKKVCFETISHNTTGQHTVLTQPVTGPYPMGPDESKSHPQNTVWLLCRSEYDLYKYFTDATYHRQLARRHCVSGAMPRGVANDKTNIDIIVSKMKPAHTLLPFNSIFPSTPKSPNRSLPFGVSYEILYVFIILNACYTSR
jgi:hypothetical protein